MLLLDVVCFYVRPLTHTYADVRATLLAVVAPAKPRGKRPQPPPAPQPSSPHVPTRIPLKTAAPAAAAATGKTAAPTRFVPASQLTRQQKLQQLQDALSQVICAPPIMHCKK